MALSFDYFLAVIVIILLSIITYRLRTRRLRQMVNRFVGPPTNLIFGNIRMFLGSTTDAFEKLHGLARFYYEKPFRLWILHEPFIALSNPKDIQVYIQIAGRLLQKYDRVYKYLAEAIGDGLITLEPEKWKRTHALVSPAFNATAIFGIYLDIFNKHCFKLMKKLKRDVEMGKSFDVGPYQLSLTVSSIHATAMGFEETIDEITSETLEEITKRGDELMTKRMIRPWLGPRFIFKAYLFMKGCSNIFEEFQEIHKKAFLKKKRIFKNAKTSGGATEQKRKSIVDILLQTDGFSDQELIDEVMTLLFAGSDTVATTTSFALLMLAQQQNFQEKAYQELYDVFGKSERLPDATDLSKLTFLEQCIKETLRMFPTLPCVLRQASNDVILSDGQIIPAGVGIFISIYTLHHSPQYYPDPEIWNPHNFDAEAIAKRPANTYIPFGVGPRTCIGYKYAMTLMKAILSTFIRNFKITTDQKETKLNITFLTKNETGYHITLNPR